jgi:hypothetical protein
MVELSLFSLLGGTTSTELVPLSATTVDFAGKHLFVGHASKFPFYNLPTWAKPSETVLIRDSTTNTGSKTGKYTNPCFSMRLVRNTPLGRGP